MGWKFCLGNGQYFTYLTSLPKVSCFLRVLRLMIPSRVESPGSLAEMNAATRRLLPPACGRKALAHDWERFLCIVALDVISHWHSRLGGKCIFFLRGLGLLPVERILSACYLLVLPSSWEIMCLPPLRLAWDHSLNVLPKFVLSVENQRLLLNGHR